MSRSHLVSVIAGKVAGRAVREVKRFAVPIAYRMIRFPDSSKFYRASERGAYYFTSQERSEIAAQWRSTFGLGSEMVDAADEVCDHVFDLLGSGKTSLGERIDWHTDFKSGESWPSHKPLRPREISCLNSTADIKVPWELSRFQHLSLLGRAYWLTCDEKYAKEFADQVLSWIEANPWGRGPNWACAMDVAIRAANWILGYSYFELSPTLDDRFRAKLVRSLWEHGWFVEHNLERQRINGNHYLSDLAGLFALGVFFASCARGRRWRDFAFDQMCREMRGQVLPDGVDYEKSISYHRLVLELFTYTFCLANINGIAIPEDVRSRWMKMFEFTSAYTKPDGTAPQIGDSDDGMFYKFGPRKAPTSTGFSDASLESGVGDWRLDHRYLLCMGALIFDRADFAAQSGEFSEEAFWTLGPRSRDRFNELACGAGATVSSEAFPEGGFYIIRSDRHYAIIDGGDNGMNGLGAHAHSDTLSFELYALDQTFIVDPGSYVYTAVPSWRNRFRSSAYHNTVTVDGQEIHPFVEGWLFALADAGDVRVMRWDVGDRTVVFEGEHDAYERLSEPVTHRRTVTFDRDDEIWTVQDELLGSGRHTFESRLHFAHGIDLKRLPEPRGAYVTVCDGANLRIEPESEVDFESAVEDGWYSPSYGRRVPIKVLRLVWTGHVPCRMTIKLTAC